MNIIFLDFDGVLFDTLKEAYIICRYSFYGTDYFYPINNQEYNNFYRYKFLVYNSWQYYYLMELLNQNLDEAELIQKYKAFMAKRDYSAEADFDKKYYFARNYLIDNHFDFWDKLEKPFPFLYKINELVFTTNLTPIIVSKKNKGAILSRIKRFNFKISEINIFGKDELSEYSSKAEFINEFIHKNNINHSVFIDDNSNNFKGVCSNVTTLLAGWGNIGINEVGYSQDETIDIITKYFE